MAIQIVKLIAYLIYKRICKMQRQAIERNYDEHARANNNKLQRQTSKTYELKAFNNWIKAVLIQTQTRQMCKTIERLLDLRAGTGNKLLHVLDIGCGRGQDIPKWKLARVQYMVALDFSEECIKTYEERWRTSHEPYRLFTLKQDFTSRDLYYQIEHSFYDIVSAQLCFHYMFGTQIGLKQGLAAILSNLLVDGVFIATIPDSYTIIKKIENKGVLQENGSKVYGNKYFSMKFDKTDFFSPYGNKYGFYLEKAVGKKNLDGTIEYTEQWLIDLDNLKTLLSQHGVEIEETMNFLDYYKKYREEYKDLFSKFKLVFPVGESMDPELWQIAHLYRVLICRKKSIGKSIREFDLKERQKSITKEVRDSRMRNNSYESRDNNRGRGNNRNSSQNYDHYRSRDNNNRYRQ